MPTGSARRWVRLWAGAAALVLIAVPSTGCARGAGVAPLPSRAVTLDGDVVQTATGAVRGVVAPDHRLFEGIPYAAPPVGPLRWRPPQPPESWQGVRDASEPGRWCVQEAGDNQPTGEDCLTLNVWTPTGTVPEPRSVMVWIHGGSFMQGSGDIYDARRLAVRGGIVVVTINYRLGALGFLAEPALGEPGNYGLADQQAALGWVRDNIAAFGGDAAKVTIAGESAGGMSVCDHLAAPDSGGLFRAGIIQSGPCQAQVDVPTAQRISRDYSASAGCADRASAAACLRALPSGKFAKPLWYARFGTDRLSGPVIGGQGLPKDPVQVITAGSAARVPVLLGVNRDEFTLFEALRYLRVGRELTAGDYPPMLSDTFGPGNTAAVQERYPPGKYGGNASVAFATAATDDIFACLADRMADGLRDSSPGVYAYEFDDPHAPAPELFKHVPFSIGASHSLEMRYLFDLGGAPPLDVAQRRLSDQMIDYWTRFVATGAPDVAGQPDWPAVGTDSGAAEWMSLRTSGSRAVTDFAVEHQCPFWASVRGNR
ncbi:MAG: carboxylesterase family protein [Mycobacterium sp.]